MFGPKPPIPAREKAGAQAIPQKGTANQFPTQAVQSRVGLVASDPVPEAPKGLSTYELRVLELLATIAGALSVRQPVFNPQRQTLAAGAVGVFDNGVIPGAWYVSIENTAGASLEIHIGEYVGFPWLVLGPGESARWPAVKSKIVFRSAAAGAFSFTVAAVSRDAMVEIRGA